MKGWTLFKDTVIQSRCRDGLAGALAAAEAWPDLQWPSVVVEVPDLGVPSGVSGVSSPSPPSLTPVSLKGPFRKVEKNGSLWPPVLQCSPHPPLDT